MNGSHGALVPLYAWLQLLAHGGDDILGCSVDISAGEALATFHQVQVHVCDVDLSERRRGQALEDAGFADLTPGDVSEVKLATKGRAVGSYRSSACWPYMGRNEMATPPSPSRCSEARSLARSPPPRRRLEAEARKGLQNPDVLVQNISDPSRHLTPDRERRALHALQVAPPHDHVGAALVVLHAILVPATLDVHAIAPVRICTPSIRTPWHESATHTHWVQATSTLLSVSTKLNHMAAPEIQACSYV